jgi:hypothetical protein
MATIHPYMRETKSSKTHIMQKLAFGLMKPRYETETKNNTNNRMPKNTVNQAISSTSQVKNSSRERPCVKFCHVDIREHGRILLDHPECKDGLALGLDWKHADNIRRIPIELYERIQQNQGKRSKKPLQRLSTMQKKVLLINIGAYRKENLWNAYCKSSQAQNMRVTLPKATAA